MSHYLGIDLTSSERRPSAWALLDDQASLKDSGEATTDGELLELAKRLAPVAIAIDAPLYLPRGLASLDDARAAVGLPTGRACERQLKSMGIGCFYTTPSSIIKSMVYRGIALRQALEARGCVVLEVFPYASKLCLLGSRRTGRKTTRAGRSGQQSALARYVPDLAIQPPLSHDQIDAIVAAYTGLLHARGRAVGLGDAGEGLLWIPAGLAPAGDYEYGARTS